MIPLTKTLHPNDFALLEPEMRTVDEQFTRAREQHPMRRWEYAMALRALSTWEKDRDYRYPRVCYDVGGGGSPFAAMLHYALEETRSIGSVTVIDPAATTDEARWDEPIAGRPPTRLFETKKRTIEQWLTDLGNFPVLADAVFCLSVLEHVDDLYEFLYHLSCLTAPGGLLFLTMDCCSGSQTEVTDIYHFHWMRKRIFSTADWASMLHRYNLFPTFQLLGEEDGWQHHGNHVYDYSFASLALVKRS